MAVSDLEFLDAFPVLSRSGSLGLVWLRLRDRFELDSAVTLAMEAAVRLQESRNIRTEQEIATSVLACWAERV